MIVHGYCVLLGVLLLVLPAAGLAAPAADPELAVGLSLSRYTLEDLSRGYGWLPGLDLRLTFTRPRPPEIIVGLSAEHRRADAYYETDTFNADASLSRILLLAGIGSPRPSRPGVSFHLAALLTLGIVAEKNPSLAMSGRDTAYQEHAHFGLRAEIGPSWPLSASGYRAGACFFLGRGASLDSSPIAEPSRNTYFGLRVDLSRPLGGH